MFDIPMIGTSGANVFNTVPMVPTNFDGQKGKVFDLGLSVFSVDRQPVNHSNFGAESFPAPLLPVGFVTQPVAQENLGQSPNGRFF